MSIDTLCEWGERMQPTPLQLQLGRVYNKGIPWMPLFFFFCATNAK
ncbi:TPA: hypothetical protein ACGUVR_003753 [Vibrio vulnificus]